MKTDLKWRIYVTLFTLAISIAFYRGWAAISHNLIEPRLAAQTADPSAVPWISLKFIQSLPSIATWCVLGFLGAIWFSFIDRRNRQKRLGKQEPQQDDGSGISIVYVLGLGMALTLTTGCGPARTDVFEEVGANDTAFVAPLVGDNLGGGQKFNSVQYLESKKVAAKRIPIPLVSKTTGRMWWDYEWIPGVKVWKVQRKLVSKEWIKTQGIPVVTSDAIKLSVGVAVTTFIEENDAATYLYYHGETPLEQVTDNNVRNYCVTELTREYSRMTLAEAKTNGPVIFARLYSDATNVFKTKGISIQQLGNAEGFEFQDPKVQDAINQRFIAEQAIQTAQEKKLAQDELNKQTVATAQAQADAAKKLLEAKEATTLQNQLDIALMQAKAQLQMAEKWDGKLPSSILPSNSPLLLNLGAQQAPVAK